MIGGTTIESRLRYSSSTDMQLLQDREQLEAEDSMVRKVLEALVEEGVDTSSKDGMCDPLGL